jgi:carboxypeptidase C (cathepsin A)
MPGDTAEAPKNDLPISRQQLEDLIARPHVETHHTLYLPDGALQYTATVGMLPLRNEESREIEAGMFFTAYTLTHDGESTDRPLMFVFNGGPGSSSIWLHMGTVGPKRVQMQDEGWLPASPYRLVDNLHTWLDIADLVLIDPVGTGFSRAAEPDLNKKFWSLDGDLTAVGQFIRLYLTRTHRWSSPLFLAGESYGTTRAAGLAGKLVDWGIAFNGIILISTILSYQTARFEQGNDLPFALFLPTYTATGWYHGRLPADLQERPLREVLTEVQQWVESEYALALMQGDKLPSSARTKLVDKLARYTGLDAQYIDLADLRINIYHFCKELLRDERRTVGRLDSRFKGIDRTPVAETPDFDPSYQAILLPYTTLLNQYIRSELGYETDIVYEPLSSKVNEEWEFEKGKFPDTSEHLRSALSKNPHMKVLVARSTYDLATPLFAVDYTLNHMGLDASLHDNIRIADYEAGHMMYIEAGSLVRLKADLADFVGWALES